jgi:hypothetical protein
MRFKISAAVAATALVCSLGAQQATAQQFPATAINPFTGEPIALNYQPTGKVVVVPSAPRDREDKLIVDPSPDDPGDPGSDPGSCDPIYDYGCQPCPSNNPAAWCYQPACDPAIAGTVEFRTGSEPNGPLDVSGSTLTNCGYLVITGIGGRIDGHDNYTTLHIRGRRLNRNGTWGETVTYRFGTEPNHELEAWLDVPDGYAITGLTIGQSQRENIEKLEIGYKKVELTSAGLRLTGPYLFKTFGASYPWYDVSLNLDNPSLVLVGVGLRTKDGEHTTTMVLTYGTLH